MALDPDILVLAEPSARLDPIVAMSACGSAERIRTLSLFTSVSGDGSPTTRPTSC